MKIVLVFFLLLSCASAQNSSTSEASNENYRLYGNIGAGFGMTGAFLAGLNYSFPNHIFQARLLSYMNYSLSEKAILYGYTSDVEKGNISFSLAAGVGHLSGQYQEGFENIYLNNAGLALQFATLYPVNEFWGGGFSLHANINEKKSVTAFSLMLSIGKLY